MAILTPPIRGDVGNNLSAAFKKAITKDTQIGLMRWKETRFADLHNTLVTSPSIKLNADTDISWSRTDVIDSITSLVIDNNLLNTDLTTRTIKSPIYPTGVITSDGMPNDLESIDSSFSGDYFGLLPWVDVTHNFSHRAVRLFDEKPIPPGDVKYLPTSDFLITDELIGFTSDFVKPIDTDFLKTALSPIGIAGSLPWKKSTPADFEKKLSYGYSINAFFVGGSTDSNYPTDSDAVDEDNGGTYKPDPGIGTGVISVVNIINVVVLPGRTPIQFTNLSLAIDLSSVAWVANFDIADQASLDLIKPAGAVVKEVEISINGELFIVFIGRTSSSINSSRGQGAVKSIKCTGWSNIKKLTYPYSPKRSYTETSSSTPAGILTGELSGTGFTATWGSPSWVIPGNVFSYIDKAPLAAILDLANAVGGVVIPDDATDTFTVQPYYPISPWQWDISTVDYSLSESQFFTMDTEWIPQDSPDTIFIYGEENGAAVKVVKAGGSGKTLPTITDKHITDTIAGRERGRIEIAKNGFKEIVPITTYIDGNGIIKPQSLLEITARDTSTWRGMVVGTSISINRNGNAIIQSLQIERHYD